MRMMYMHPGYRRARARQWMDEGVHIPVNVSAQDDNYVIRAYVPGVVADELEIEVEGNLVTLGGEFALESSEEERSLLSELPSGRFQRRIRLGAELDASKAQAEVRDGVLILSVPKAESAKTKRIEVKAK